MVDRLADWVAVVHACYPESDAADWDSTGLQVGDPGDEVRGVLVCLDVTEATISEALAREADVLLAHHPLLFSPLQRLTPETAAGRLALRSARSGLAVLAAHTNFDVAEGGTSDPVLRILGVTEATPLVAHPQEEVKLVAFVPPEDTPAVLSALAEAGAGVIGEYDHCSYRISGTGTFRPSAAANPATGEREQLNEVHEERLEVVVPRARTGEAVSALLAAHPYEEVAYDLYPLLPAERSAKGLGRIGLLDEETSLGDIADRLRRQLPAPFLRVAGALDRRVRRVAACGGAGDSLVPAAIAAGAELYVTGDLRHHATLDAQTLGLALIDAGHYATEAAALPAFIDRLGGVARERGLTARLLASDVRTEPWTAYHLEGSV